jgi:hypothetical protein
MQPLEHLSGFPSKSLSESPMAVIETILLTPLPEHFKLNP